MPIFTTSDGAHLLKKTKRFLKRLLALTLVRITGSKIGLILKGAQPSSNSFISKFLAADCYTTQWTKIWQKNEEKPCLKIYG